MGIICFNLFNSVNSVKNVTVNKVSTESSVVFNTEKVN